MFKIIKNFNWIILSSFLCIFMGIVTFLTFINEGFIKLTDKNLQTLLIIDIFLLLIFFSLIFKNFYRFYYTGKKNKKGSQTNLKYISFFSLFTVIPSLLVAIFSLFIFNFGIQNYFDKQITRAVNNSFDEGIKIERKLFMELVTGTQSAAQRYAFFAQRQVAKIPDIEPDTEIKPFSSID